MLCIYLKPCCSLLVTSFQQPWLTFATGQTGALINLTLVSLFSARFFHRGQCAWIVKIKSSWKFCSTTVNRDGSGSWAVRPWTWFSFSRSGLTAYAHCTGSKLSQHARARDIHPTITRSAHMFMTPTRADDRHSSQSPISISPAYCRCCQSTDHCLYRLVTFICLSSWPHFFTHAKTR